MQSVSILSIVLLLGIWGAQLKLRSLLSKKIKLITVALFLAPAAQLAVYSYTLYGIWLNSPAPIKYFLPPHTNISYYFFTIGRRFWISYFIAALIALIFLSLMHAIPKKRREQIFEIEEPYIIAIAILLVGHPLWIVFVVCSLIIYLLISLLAKGKRVSLYYAWIPISIALLCYSLSSPLALSTLDTLKITF